MEEINEIVSSIKSKSIVDHINLYNRLIKEIDINKFKDSQKIKISILSNFTIKGIKETLFVKCYELGVLADFYITNYNQYIQDILNEESDLYKFDSDLIIIFIDIKSILGDLYLLPYKISDNEREGWVNERLEELKSIINKIKKNTRAKIILHNFEVPLYSPLGILENKQKFGYIESIRKLNSIILDLFKYDHEVFILDYDSFCSKVGKQNIIDYKLYYLADIRIDFQYLVELCDIYMSYIKSIKGITKKCIVLDLDNTLWGGIIGEDGLEGIKLGPDPNGKPFLDFQRYLLSLFNRGIILAINSHNNLNDVLKIFKEHPHMILKEENFASLQINWDDKVSNMKKIIEEINIGMDSVVFIDDDKLNREMVKNSLPQVLVIDMPEDPSLYIKKMIEINDFDTLQITDEDKIRGKMYAEQRKRDEFKNYTTEITQYFKGLNMVITIENANQFNIPRIFQLIQKTNQFNMTTKRYSESEIRNFPENNNFLIFSVNVKDKFGDNGNVGVIIIEKKEGIWIIDTFLLSCRVIGRKIEENLLKYILDKLKKEKIKILIGEFIPTNKNIPAKDFYKNNGFKFIKNNGDIELWEYDVDNSYEPTFLIKVEDKL